MSIMIRFLQVILVLSSVNLLFGLPMGKMKDSETCSGDDDCPNEQYCYDVSGQCVDYTRCHRYYRQESQGYSRDPSQCGPCIKGYAAELLSIGDEAIVCKKITPAFQGNETDDLDLYPNKNSEGLATIVIVIVVILSFFIVTLFVFVYLRKPIIPVEHNDRKTRVNDIFGPTAPPPENSPFIGFGEQINLKNMNNNRNEIDKNILVAASPFKAPTWIQINPSYGRDSPSDHLDPPNDQLPAPISQEEDTNPSSWTPEQLTIQVPSRPFSMFSNEQHDNPPNSDIVQRIRPGRDNPLEQGLNSDHGDRENNSEPSGNRDNNNVRSSNVMITQKITMNVNVLNGVNDC